MPPSEMDLEPPPEWQTSDDLVIRLVEEMAGAAGGSGTSHFEDSDLAIVEQRLDALRAASEVAVDSVLTQPPVERPIPAAAPRETRTGQQRREPAASVDAVILEAVEAAGARPDPRPVRERQKLRPAGRGRRRRSRPTFYLTALFLVTLSVAFLALNRSWFDGLTVRSPGDWTEPMPALARDRSERPVGLSVGAIVEAAPPHPAVSAQAGAEPATGPAGWIRRKVKVYKVNADGTIDFGAREPRDKLASP